MRRFLMRSPTVCFVSFTWPSNPDSSPHRTPLQWAGSFLREFDFLFSEHYDKQDVGPTLADFPRSCGGTQMKIDGAVIREQGVTFAVVVVKAQVLNNSSEADGRFGRSSPCFPACQWC